MPGSEVRRWSSPTTPLSTASPALSATAVFGLIPTPTTSRSASTADSSERCTTAASPSLSIDVMVAPVRRSTPCEECRSAKICATSWPRTRSNGSSATSITVTSASAARQAEAEVTVIEVAELPLLRVLGHEVAQIFADLHSSHGVDLRTGATITSIDKDGDAAVVHLSDGSAVEADLLVVGVGISPNTAVAESAGLAVDNGVVVDDHLRTSDPGIYAAGDVANAQHPTLGRPIRVEHWDNAIEQGVVAGKNMTGGDVAYDRLPYFFTDQYDLSMEYVGHVGPDGYDDVVLRGDPQEYVFTAFWLAGGHVVAGMQANDWDAMDAVRKIVSAGGRVAVEALRDESRSLAQIVPED